MFTVGIIVWQHSTISKILFVDSSFNFFHAMTPVCKISSPDVRGGSRHFFPVYVQREATRGQTVSEEKNVFICQHSISKATGPVNLYLLIKSLSYLCQGNIRTSVWESHYLILSSPGSGGPWERIIVIFALAGWFLIYLLKCRWLTTDTSFRCIT